MSLAKIVLKQGYKIPEFPVGWFVIAETKNLKQGEIQTHQFCGKEVVLYRTVSGQAVVTDAYCPHMGAHLGCGGAIVGEEIKCPFHGFQFDKNGTCTKTGYDTKPSPRAKLYSWPVEEKFGLIFCYYNPERIVPDWGIKDIDMKGWTDFKIQTWKLVSNPIEISENSVDIGHFAHIHGFKDPHTIGPLNLDGPLLNACYGMYRKDFLKKNNWIKIEFEIFQQGLGFALVEAHTLDYGIRTRHLVMPSAKDGKEIYLRVGSSVKTLEHPEKINKLLKFFPKQLLTNLIARTAFKEYCAEVYSDFKIWSNKINIHPPALSKGDGPIMQYRQWAAQFDPNLVLEDEVNNEN
jgi:nitrite reductase/ring-hydroxylating ferredoxin subunit